MERFVYCCNLAARKQPLNFRPNEFFVFAQAKNDPGIVGREVAPATHLHAVALQIASLIADARANRIGIGLFPDELQTQPVIARCRLIF